MRRIDKAYWSAWVLLSVFVPMVLLSSLHVHPDLLEDGEPCHECIDHTVHNGHIAAVKAAVDCPLCAFQSNVYQGGQEAAAPHADQPVIRLMADRPAPSVTLDVTGVKPGRAPPCSFCA